MHFLKVVLPSLGGNHRRPPGGAAPVLAPVKIFVQLHPCALMCSSIVLSRDPSVTRFANPTTWLEGLTDAS